MSVTPTAAAASVCSMRRMRGHLLARDAPIRSARVTVGDDAVGHRHAGVGPFRGGSRIAEVAVVGVGDDHEDAFDSVDL